MASPVAVWGLGDQFRVLKPILLEAGYGVVAGVDDTEAGRAGWSADFPVVRDLSGLERLLGSWDPSEVGFIVAIGNPYGRTRLRVAERLRSTGMYPVSVVAPTAIVYKSASIGAGAQIMVNSIVHEAARMGDQVIVNTAAVIEHDCILGAGAEIGPHATLCGRVEVGSCAWVGAGAVVLPRVRIGADAIVGAGACVTRDVRSGEVVVGNPASVVHDSPMRFAARADAEGSRQAMQLGGSPRDASAAESE